MTSSVRCLTVREAAKALGIGEKRLYELCAQDVVPHIHIGRSVRIPVVELLQWIANQCGGVVLGASAGQAGGPEPQGHKGRTPDCGDSRGFTVTGQATSIVPLAGVDVKEGDS